MKNRTQERPIKPNTHDFQTFIPPFFQLTFCRSGSNFICLIFPLDIILILISHLLRREFRFLLPFPWTYMTPR